MAWCSELTIIARCCHFAKNILIGIAHRISIVHIEVVDTFHYLCQSSRTLNKERGVLHKSAVRRFLALIQVLYEDKGIFADRAIHSFRFLVLEHAPS